MNGVDREQQLELLQQRMLQIELQEEQEAQEIVRANARRAISLDENELRQAYEHYDDQKQEYLSGESSEAASEEEVATYDHIAAEDEEEEGEEDADDESGEETSWITWFCSLRENDFLCEVDEEYIEDDFNLTGLSGIVPYYEYALDLILDIENPNEQHLTQMQQEMVESAAEMLYGLIHARYILTTKGMAAMLEKYRNVEFGRCHRVFCQGQPVLPVGQSDGPRHTTVNVFCPKCREIYFPKSQRAGQIDGAYFGSTFPHMFLMTHSYLVPAPPTQTYTPRVFGYKVHASSEYYIGRRRSTQGSTTDDRKLWMQHHTRRMRKNHELNRVFRN
uniref:Casein kinase II subunit beta n=1 Tax=Albugo laibachii Nc14 TaxID=890382 RepID=F0W6R1_9STRA|nr:casein kinase II subunit beta putative [Albugo laibachii Nc14]|eukprot:CCA16806.1 casein kinase II subunit beta putative [Albugo laibachii Nc14]